MRRICLLCVMLCLLGSHTSAGQNKNRLHAQLFLKTDSVAEGYLQNFLGHGGLYHTDQLNSSDSIIRINHLTKLFKKDEKYRNQEIDSMITWYDQKPQIKIKWVPQMANLAYGFNEPMIYDHPLMLCVMFRGKHVTGYVVSDPVLGRRCLYKMDDMPQAKAFFNLDGKLSKKRRQTLEEEFGNYQGMEDYLKTVNQEELKRNPFIILQKLDEILGLPKEI